MVFRPLDITQPVPLPNTACELHVFFQELNQYGTAATALLERRGAMVPIISTPQGFNEDELYVDLEPNIRALAVPEM